MAARLVREAKDRAGPAPFCSVRCDPPTTGAMVREQMRELVTQGAIHFRVAELAQPQVEDDCRFPRISRARGAPHPCIPPRVNPRGKLRFADRLQQFAAPRRERFIRLGERCGRSAGARDPRQQSPEEVELRETQTAAS